MSGVPASKVNSLINELNLLAAAPDSIDELKLHRVAVEAKKLPNFEERHMIMAIIDCIKDEPAAWLKNFNKAFSFSSTSINLLDTFFKSSIRLNFEHEAYFYALTARETIYELSTGLYAIRVLLACGDFQSAYDACKLLRNAYSNQFELLNKLDNNEYFTMESVNDFANADVDYGVMSEITRKLMNYAYEKYGSRAVNKKIELIEDDSLIASNSIYFDKIDAQGVADLDDYVLDMLISKESESNVQRFVFHLLSNDEYIELRQA